jgi:hypothetical protein
VDCNVKIVEFLTDKNKILEDFSFVAYIYKKLYKLANVNNRN